MSTRHHLGPLSVPKISVSCTLKVDVKGWTSMRGPGGRFRGLPVKVALSLGRTGSGLELWNIRAVKTHSNWIFCDRLTAGLQAPTFSSPPRAVNVFISTSQFNQGHTVLISNLKLHSCFLFYFYCWLQRFPIVYNAYVFSEKRKKKKPKRSLRYPALRSVLMHRLHSLIHFYCLNKDTLTPKGKTRF